MDKEQAENESTGKEKNSRRGRGLGLGWRILCGILKALLWLICFLVFLAVVAIVAAVIYWNFFLAEDLNRKWLPVLGEKVGLDEVEMKIRRLGLTGLDLEDFRLIGEDGRELYFNSIRADYTPHWPFGGDGRVLDVSNVTLAGGEIRATYRDGAWAVSGFELEKVVQAVEALLDAAAEKVGAAPAKGDDEDVSAFVLRKVTLRDLWITLQYEDYVLVIPVRAEVVSEDDAWQKLRADILISPRGQQIQISADYDAAAEILQLQSDSRIRLESFADLMGFRLGGSSLMTLDASATLSGGDINLQGRLDVVADLPADSGLPVVFAEPLEIRQNFLVRYRSADDELKAVLEGELAPPRLTMNGGVIAARINQPVTWKSVLAHSPQGFTLTDTAGTIPDTVIDAHGFTVRIPLLSLEQDGDRFRVAGREITAENAELDLRAEGITVGFPLLPEKAEPGTLTIAAIRVGESEAGDVAADFYMDGQEIHLTGDFHNQLLPEVRVQFRGEVIPRPGDAPDMAFEINIPPWKPTDPLQLRLLHAAFGDATLDLVLSAGGAVRLAGGKLTTGMLIMADSGRFIWPEMKLDMQNVRLDLRFNDLIGLETPGGQRLRIGRMKYGNMDFSNIELDFGVNSKEEAILERATFDWCRGNVLLHSVKLDPTNLDRLNIDTDLFCEHLQLAEIIRQLQLGEAAGEGALFGKIPVKFSARRGLRIDSSYLYSRPGMPGVIQITNPDQMLGGMANAAAQQSQLDFALEALRDFTYDWTRMTFATDQEDLMLTLQFDGRPNELLPFGYDDQSGQLRRDNTYKARFEGLQLTINTRLPLNWLLKLNEKLDEFKK